jgi:hypothetical protein
MELVHRVLFFSVSMMLYMFVFGRLFLGSVDAGMGISGYPLMDNWFEERFGRQGHANMLYEFMELWGGCFFYLESTAIICLAYMIII